MADSTRYQRMTLTMSSPWNLGADTTHEWHCKFSLSGSTDLASADQEATALDLWDPISRLTNQTSLVAWSFYPIGATVSAGGATYPIGTHISNRVAYTGAGTNQQLEVCIVPRNPVKKSSTGKQVYLRKWIHNCEADNSDPNAHNAITSLTNTFEKWNDGAGPRLLVPVDPTTGEQGTTWAPETHLFTRQLRKGPKRTLRIDSNGVIPPP